MRSGGAASWGQLAGAQLAARWAPCICMRNTAVDRPAGLASSRTTGAALGSPAGVQAQAPVKGAAMPAHQATATSTV